MARKYYSRRRRYFRKKQPTERSIRQGSFTSSNTSLTQYMYTATDPCKFCNCSLEIGLKVDNDPSTAQGPLWYALVYVPEGYDANPITISPVNDVYNPTKNVLIIGTLTNYGEMVTKWSKTSRKMMIGDRIALVILGGSEYPSGSYTLQFTTVH